ncbi:hypothetical protein [Devosia sp. A16]|uniref:hypothetical protein n=1 Tax=Devosia sp. A16 TaxID=1736675 RepID=UPI0006D7D741|nr:hypothetical protein [Devosia sp. A16]
MIITDRNTLSVLLIGSTHYIEMAPGQEAAIYYRTADEAHMALPDGTRRVGRWRITETGYQVDWTDGPSAGWQLDAEPGRIGYVDAGGVERGRVSRIVPGDAAALAA